MNPEFRKRLEVQSVVMTALRASFDSESDRTDAINSIIKTLCLWLGLIWGAPTFNPDDDIEVQMHKWVSEGL